MKSHLLQKTLLLVSMLTAGNAVLAHELSGALGSAASATDSYQVHCYDDGNGAADHLYFHIKDLLPNAAPVVSAQVTMGRLAASTTDAVDGDAAYSPAINVKGGNNSYYFVTVDKTKLGAENYSFEYHCMTATGSHTGTDILPLANQ
jgi:hypothetical protein